MVVLIKVGLLWLSNFCHHMSKILLLSIFRDQRVIVII